MPGASVHAQGIQNGNGGNLLLEFVDTPILLFGLDPVCGDGNRDSLEDCDGTDFGTATCATVMGGEGTLACTSGCVIDASDCHAVSSSSSSSSSSAASVPSGASGNGGGGRVSQSSVAKPAPASSSKPAAPSSSSSRPSASSAKPVVVSRPAAPAPAPTIALEQTSSASSSSVASAPTTMTGTTVLPSASASVQAPVRIAPCDDLHLEAAHGAAPVVPDAVRLALAAGVGLLLLWAAGRPLLRGSATGRRSALFSSRTISSR